MRILFPLLFALCSSVLSAADNWAVWYVGANADGIPTDRPARVEYIGDATTCDGCDLVATSVEQWRKPPILLPNLGGTLAQSKIANLTSDLAGKAATAHTHAAADIVSGVIPISRLATGTPNGTKFIRDDGTLATPPTGGSSTANARVTADRTTTSLTAVNATDMVFAIPASETWTFEFNLRVGSSSTAGIKLAITVPSGATFMATGLGNAASATAFTSEILSASGTLGVTYQLVNGQNGVVRITGTVVNGANAGNVQLQFAKVTSGTATVAANSYLTARKL